MLKFRKQKVPVRAWLTLMEEMYWVMMSAVLAPGWSSRRSNLSVKTSSIIGEETVKG